MGDSKKQKKLTEDLISGLPDHVLHQILGLLPFKAAVRTSILSKRWRKMDPCSTLPHLNFRRGFFENRALTGYNRKRLGRIFNKNSTKKNRRSIKILDKVLQRRGCQRSNLMVEKFGATIPSMHQPHKTEGLDPFISFFLSQSHSFLQSKIERWMMAVANPGLTVLDVKINMCQDACNYDFPMDALLASSKSLRSLFLSGFRLMTSLSWQEQVDVSFPCLEQITLEKIKLEDCVMQTLLKGSPLLMKLILYACHGLKFLKVVGLSRLEMLQVINAGEGLEKIVIDAPYLRKLILHTTPSVIHLATRCQFLNKLNVNLHAWKEGDIPFQFEGSELPIEKWIGGLVDSCLFLQKLTISSNAVVKNIHISSTLHSLKKLKLEFLENLVSFEIVAPNLKKFCIFTKNNLPSIRLHASDKVKVELVFSKFRPADVDTWYTRLPGFLTFFNHFTNLKVSWYIHQRCSLQKDWSNHLPLSLLAVKSLELRMWEKWNRPFSDCVDYMLWLCPQATHLTLVTAQRNVNATDLVLKCSYDERNSADHIKDGCCQDCNLLKIKCWRHSLKEVIVDKFLGDEMEKLNLKNFLNEQVENLHFADPSEIDFLEGGSYHHYDTLFT